MYPASVLKSLAACWLTGFLTAPLYAINVLVTDLGSQPVTRSIPVGENSAAANLTVVEAAQDFTFAWTMDLSPHSTGDSAATNLPSSQVIFEIGGNTNGVSLVYRTGNLLTVTATESDVAALQFSVQIYQDDLDAGVQSFVLSYDYNASGNETCSLYIDGIRRGVGSGESGSANGANAGSFVGFPGAANNLPGNLAGNWDLPLLTGAGGVPASAALTFVDYTTGSVSSLSFYQDVLVTPPPVAAGGPGVPNVPQVAGTKLAEWLTSTTHSDRNLMIGFHRGYLWIQSRPDDGGRNLIMVYDISDPSNPIEVHRRDHPSGSIRPQHWAFMTEGDKFLIPSVNQQFHDMSDMLNIRLVPDAPYDINRGDVAAEFFQLPYQYNGQYGYGGGQSPLHIRNIKTGALLSSQINPEADFGFPGHPLVIGNLLIAVGSRFDAGVATYDVSNPSNPVLLDVITSELDTNPNDSFANGGGYEPAVWGSYVVYGNENRTKPQIKAVDFSDPGNLRLVAHMTNPALRSARYLQFQDEYLFTGNAKVDMRDFSIVRTLKQSNVTDDLSEYLLPLGNLVVIGEHQGANGGKAYIIAHQNEPDTRAPFVTYNNPVANSTNMHVLSRIGLVIPETLNPLTIHGGTFIVRPYGGAPIAGTLTYTDKDIINFAPDQPLLPDTTYEVVLPAGGIQDISGNGIEEFCFAFSTGPVLNPLACTGIPVTYGNGGQPGSGLPWPFSNPGTLRIEAENFNQGGEGVGYHDSDGINDGGGTRADEGVDLFVTPDTGGGIHVGNVVAEEWLDYTVQVPATGTYHLRLRAANTGASPKSMRILLGSDASSLADITGTITIPDGGAPGGFQTQTVSNVQLTQGLQLMRVFFDQGGVNLNWMEIEGVQTLPDAVAWYDMEGDADDRSPSGFDGVMRNFPASPFTTEAVVENEALQLDGVDDYVAITDFVYNANDLPAVAVSCWIKTSDSAPQVIASFDRDEYWRLSITGSGITPGHLGWHVMTATGQQDFESTRRLDDGTWHHVVAVFDGAAQEMRLYVDGALDATRPGVGSVFGTGTPRYGFLGVGSEATGFDGTRSPEEYFNGTMDDMRVFDVALGQEQVQALFLLRQTSQPPVVTHIGFSEYPANTGSELTITVTASDPDNEPLEYRLNPGDGSGFTEWSSVGTFTLTYAAESHYGITVQVRDLSGTQTVSTSAVTVLDSTPQGPPPTRSTPITGGDANRVWVVNPDNNTVTSIDTDTLTNEFEVPVGADPRSIARAGTGEIWVTCHDADRLDVLSAADGSLITSLSLAYGAEPYGIAFSPDGSVGYVSLQGSGQLLRIDPVSRVITGTLALGFEPRAIAVSSSGDRVLVTRFTSPESHGEIYDVDAATFTMTRIITLTKDASPDTSNGGRGVPNYLAGIAITPDGAGAWVSSKKDNTDRGVFREGQAFTHENTVRSILSYIDLATNSEDISKRIDIDNSSSPMGIALSPLGDFMFIAMQGNNRLQAIDTFDRTEANRWLAGKAPQGVWYVPGNDRLVAKNFMDRTVSVYDARAFVREGKGLGNLATIPTVANEALSSAVLLGKQVFYDSEDPRMALDGYLTCATCHQDGGTDNRVWDFTERGEGLRNTTDLRSRRGISQGFVHWSANFDEIQDFEHDIRNGFGGDGFLPDAAFNTGTRNTTLGDPKAGLSVELDALAAYVTSLETVGRSPYRTTDGELTAAAKAGRVLFAQLNCIACHSGDSFTDSNNSPKLHDVGTIKPGSGQRLGGPLAGIDAPTLRGLWRTAPYLHHGDAATLQDVLTTENPSNSHGVTSTLTTTEIDSLVAYLNQIDDSEPSLNPEANSGFVLVDDFDGYPLDSNMVGQGGWNTNGTRAPITAATVKTDPSDLANQVMSLFEVTVNGNQAAISRQALSVESGSTATLFFRMRHTALSGDPDTPMGVGTNNDGSLGTMDILYKIRGNGSNGQFRVENVPTADNLDPDVWFDVWWVITRNATAGTDTLDLYLHSEADPDYATRQHVATFTDVTPAAGIIDTLTFTKFNNNGRLLIDDIYYFDKGVNLSHPLLGEVGDNDFAVASTLSSKEVELNWTGDPGTEIYYIEQADSPDGPWTPVRRILGAPSPQVVSGLEPLTNVAFRISALNGDGNLISRDIVQAITNEPYDDWAERYSLPAADYGKMKDPDGDGIPNFFERAYGTNPVSADPGLAPYLKTTGGQVCLIYRRDPEAVDLTMIPQLSLDLVQWDEGNLVITDSLFDIEEGIEVRQAEIMDTVIPEDSNAVFMRIRIESE